MTSGGRFVKRNSGRRELSSETALLSNLSRMLHSAKVAHKEKTLVKKVEKLARKGKCETAPALENQGKETKMGSSNTMVDKPVKKKKRLSNKRGGSVWIVLKGGFNASGVPLNKTNGLSSKGFYSAAEKRAMKRLNLELLQREKRLQDAEAYIDSAWREAENGGLLEAPARSENKGKAQRGIPTEDGVTYLKEQYKVASQILSRPPIGQFMMDLINQHDSTGLSSKPCSNSMPSHCLGILQEYLNTNRDRWKKLLHGEKFIGLGYTAETESASNILVSEQEVRDELTRCWMPIAEKCNNDDGVVNDIEPEKCIVRIRNSQQEKHSAIISDSEAINSFKINILKVIKKGLSNSLLSKSGNETGHESENSGKKISANKMKNRQSQPQKESAKRGGKRRK